MIAIDAVPPVISVISQDVGAVAQEDDTLSDETCWL